MQKQVYTKSLLFKSLLVAVFGAFFFVQVQSQFIFCAYDTDFAAGSTFSLHSAGTHITRDKATTDAHLNVKLNKRYQVVTPHAIMPAPAPSLPVYFTVLYSKWYTRSVPTHAYFLYTKPLRGPPVV